MSAQYRIGLIDRIGLPLVEWLEGKHKPLKPTIQELQFLRTYYRNRAKEAENYANYMVTIALHDPIVTPLPYFCTAGKIWHTPTIMV